MIHVTLTNVEYAEGILFTGSGDGLIEVSVVGHARPAGEYDGDTCRGFAKGENLVSAAVSHAALNLLRSIAIIAGIRPDYASGEGNLRIAFRMRGLADRQIETLKVLFESFIIGILDLREKNPGTIELNMLR